MNCLLSTLSETQFDLNRGQHGAVKHPGDVTGIICSFCFQIILASTQEKIKAAYQVALDKRLLDKAKALETFIEVEHKEYDNGKTEKLKPDTLRRETLRMVKPALNKIGAQQAVI